MPVPDYDEFDLVAVGQDGTLVLNMREDRSVNDVGVDAELLIRDFRRKLDHYVHAISSGYAAQFAVRKGVTKVTRIRIELSSFERPAPGVMAMLESVGRELPGVNVTGVWVDLSDVGLDVIEQALVTTLTEELRPGWKSVQLWVYAVGGFRYATIEATYGLMKTVRSEPSENVWAMLGEHKRVSYDERTGTWMSGHVLIERDDFKCVFHNDGAPEGMPPLDQQDYRREFELYPRVLAHIPESIKQLNGSTLLITPIIEGISATDVDAETLEAEVLKVFLPLLPRKWTFAYMWFSMVGGEGHAGISVTVGKGAVQNLQPPEAMLALLTRLKKAAYDPRTGTWMSGRLEFKPGGQYRSQFSNSETPEWVPAPTAAEYRYEFEVYPRDPSEIPESIRRLVM